MGNNKEKRHEFFDTEYIFMGLTFIIVFFGGLIVFMIKGADGKTNVDRFQDNETLYTPKIEQPKNTTKEKNENVSEQTLPQTK